MEKINRRSALKATGAALAGLVAGTAMESQAQQIRRRFPNLPFPRPAAAAPAEKGLKFNNADFYDLDGSFNEDKVLEIAEQSA